MTPCGKGCTSQIHLTRKKKSQKKGEGERKLKEYSFQRLLCPDHLPSYKKSSGEVATSESVRIRGKSKKARNVSPSTPMRRRLNRRPIKKSYEKRTKPRETPSRGAEDYLAHLVRRDAQKVGMLQDSLSATEGFHIADQGDDKAPNHQRGRKREGQKEDLTGIVNKRNFSRNAL